MPSISVVIPTYNCGAYLTESLDSIFAQAGSELEVIVVDDGSTDETPAVLARYAGRLIVVPGTHGGISAARNLGLGRATGQWIAFHDADDVALPDRLAFQQGVLRERPEYNAVFCDGEWMPGMAHAGDPVVPADVAARAAGHRLTAADVFAGFPIYFQGALIPRAAFVAAGRFDPDFRVQPDIEYAYRLLPHCRAVFVPRPVFRYRWHTTNNSRDRLGGREDIARILERVAGDPDAVRLIGRSRLQRRLARHWFRIARTRLARGDRDAGRTAARRAAALRPFDPRYQLLRCWHAS